MDDEMKARWIAALRSGRYTQTKLDLQNENGYCCLGVLCDIEGKKATDWAKGYDWLTTVLSSKVLSTAWTMNDQEGKTFSEIADWLEATDIGSSD